MKKRNFILGSVIMLAVFLVVGGTLAWFTASVDPVENKFTAGTLEIELVDEFEGAPNVNPGDCFEKIVYVKNTGSKRAVIRIKKDILLVSDPNGPSDENLDISVVEYELGEGWVEIDGYFYYNGVVNPGGQTNPLFANNRICFNGPNMGNKYQGSILTITIEPEAIQATNGAPTAEGWAIDPLSPPPSR